VSVQVDVVWRVERKSMSIFHYERETVDFQGCRTVVLLFVCTYTCIHVPVCRSCCFWHVERKRERESMSIPKCQKEAVVSQE
jgi:hypothetical protein